DGGRRPADRDTQERLDLLPPQRARHRQGPSGAASTPAQTIERREAMTMQKAQDETPSYPYATHLNILFDQLEKIDAAALGGGVKDRWWNQTLCQVNGSVVRLGVMQGEYHWHKHDEDDEFFFCLDGEFLVDLEDKTIALRPRQGVVVPKGVVHRTRAPQKCVILMVENAGITPTGD